MINHVKLEADEPWAFWALDVRGLMYDVAKNCKSLCRDPHTIDSIPFGSGYVDVTINGETKRAILAAFGQQADLILTREDGWNAESGPMLSGMLRDSDITAMWEHTTGYNGDKLFCTLKQIIITTKS